MLKTKKKKETRKEFFKRSDIKNYIEFPFNELVNNEFPKELNYFNLVKKRTYCNIMDLIIDYDNKIFSEYPRQDELILVYLNLKWKIDKKSYENDNNEDNEREFLEDLYNQLFVKDFSDFIEDYVERNYTLNIDEINQEKGKKFNPVLQFSDAHCKMLQSISIGMKMSIPLILHYAFKYGIKTTNDYLEKSFDYLFKIFSKDVDLTSKLWESVYSRLIVTKVSDRVFWKYVEIEGNSIQKVTSSLYQKLIVDIIPKYELEQNLINLNHVFINNNIDYTFRSNFDINYKPLNLAETEDDVSDWDKLSINTARIDEGEIVMNELNIKKTIPMIMKKENIKITKEEFKYYEKDFTVNKLQKNLLFNFFARYFGDSDVLLSGNRKQYIMLTIIMKKILIKNDFSLLPCIITASIKNINEKSTLNKKLMVGVMDSAEYNNLINDKYHFTENNVKNKSSIILLLIANIMNNKFLYKEYDNQELLGEEIKISNNYVLAEEILRFVSLT